MKKHLSILLIMLAIATIQGQNRNIDFHHGTFDELLAKAKKENKMIYIDCFTTWCGPCKWMAKNVFTNDTVADFYNKSFVNAKIDMENGEGIEIAKKYGIRAYPTMLYINADGVQLHRTCGSAPAKNFISIGENALSPNKQLATYATNFKEGKITTTSASAYFSMLENACQSYSTELNSYFASVNESDLKSRGNWEIIYKHVEDYNSKTFQSFEADRENFAKLFNNDSVDNKIKDVYTNALYSAIQKKDMLDYESLKTKLRKSNTKDAEKIIIQTDIRLYQISQDWVKYAASVSEYITKYDVQNPNELNSYAWTFYEQIEDKKMLANAEIWAKKAAELNDDYATYDTYAAVLYKLGKKSDAKITAQKAIDIAKKNGDDYKETEALLKKINAIK